MQRLLSRMKIACSMGLPSIEELRPRSQIRSADADEVSIFATECRPAIPVGINGTVVVNLAGAGLGLFDLGHLLGLLTLGTLSHCVLRCDAAL